MHPDPSPTFLHSGNVGDLIYSLPTVRALGGGELLLRTGIHRQWGAVFPPALAELLIPLLLEQPYVHGVRVHDGQAPDFRLDRFRGFEAAAANLVTAHLDAFGLPAAEADRAWLQVSTPIKVEGRPVVFSRTPRYRNAAFDWHGVMDELGERALFVGLESEHAEFVAEFGQVPFRPTHDFLELAHVIAGAELFVGNQSAPTAIAEGLKVETMLEVCPTANNCLFDRDGQRAYLSFSSAGAKRLRRRFDPGPPPRCQPSESPFASPKSPRHVLCATTRQWNPGDELILQGVRNVLETMDPADNPVSVCIFDRSPALRQTAPFLSNSWRGQSLRGFDEVIVAGTPEWYGPVLEPLYRAIERDGVEPIMLGLGAGTADLRLSPLDRRVLGRAKVLTVRDANAQRALREIGLDPQLIPCPALLASRSAHVRTRKQRVGLVLQRDEVTCQSISTSTLEQVLAMHEGLDETYEVEVVCNYVDEYLWALERFERVRYSYDSADYLPLFARYDVVVSTRLHGAIAALSTGAPSLLINGTFRCSGAAAAVPALRSVEPRQVLRVLEGLDVEGDSRAALALKERERERYARLLSAASGQSRSRLPA